MYYRYRFPTHVRARYAVAQYIERFYNQKGHHSTVGYRTPVQALADHHGRRQGSLTRRHSKGRPENSTQLTGRWGGYRSASTARRSCARCAPTLS